MYSRSGLKFSITFKDTLVLKNINNHISNVMGINVIRPHIINNVDLERKINTNQTFKSNECVICLTNPPNVLFCNCGHLCLCVECDKVKSLRIVQCVKLKTKLDEFYKKKIFFSIHQRKYFIISCNVPMLGYAHHPPIYTFYHHSATLLTSSV